MFFTLFKVLIVFLIFFVVLKSLQNAKERRDAEYRLMQEIKFDSNHHLYKLQKQIYKTKKKPSVISYLFRF